MGSGQTGSGQPFDEGDTHACLHLGGGTIRHMEFVVPPGATPGSTSAATWIILAGVLVVGLIGLYALETAAKPALAVALANLGL